MAAGVESRWSIISFATLLLPMTLSEFGSASQDALLISFVARCEPGSVQQPFPASPRLKAVVTVVASGESHAAASMRQPAAPNSSCTRLQAPGHR
jgi:hypothetical protein